jgi:hypothetical protein
MALVSYLHSLSKVCFSLLGKAPPTVKTSHSPGPLNAEAITVFGTAGAVVRQQSV